LLIADTLDSQIVGRLLRTTSHSATSIRRYHRAVGWLVVALSFGMAGYAIAEGLKITGVLPDAVFSTWGVAAAAIVAAVLAVGRLLERRPG
jgi:high-affinity nickel-transport protein